MSDPVISLLMPTRGRPALVDRFFESVVANTNDLDSIEVVLYVDSDDTESHGLDSDKIKVRRIVGPRLSMGEYNTSCLKKSVGQIIVLANDDMVIRTPDWDNYLRDLDASVGDGIYLAYANDLFKGERLCTFPILSRKACNLLNDPYPAEYRGAFIDYHLMDIFKRLSMFNENRIYYLEGIVFEHLHYRLGKAEMDVTYSERNRFGDDQAFLALIEQRQFAAERLYSAILGRTIPETVASHSQREALPENLINIFAFVTRKVLFDARMPLQWRMPLWLWLLARQVVARRFLRPSNR